MYTIYSKYGCPYCDKIKNIMQLAEQKHVVYELGTDYTREEFYEEFGNGSTNWLMVDIFCLLKSR